MTEPRQIEDLAVTVESTERLDGRIMRGSAWVAVSYGGSHIVSLLTTLALVRLLDPKAFGLVALAWTFLIVADQIQGAGTTAALVYRRKNVTGLAASAFVLTLITSAALIALSMVLAPLAARLFGSPELTNVLRVMSLMLLTKAFGAIPLTLLERGLDFRSRAKCELVGALVQAGIALGLAAVGYGVWALVLGAVAGSAAQSAAGWIVAPWHPNPRRASFALMREMIRYGRYVSATNIVNLANNSVDNLVIGRLAGVTTLGYYAVAFRIADFPNTVIGQIVTRVMFPVYALLQEERDRFRRAYLQNLQRIAVFALPVGVFILVAPGPLVDGLLGEKWDPAVTPLRILAAYGLVKCFTAPSGEVFKGAGRPALGLAVGLLQFALVLPALVVLVPTSGISGAGLAMLIGISGAGVPRLVFAMRLVHATLGDLLLALARPMLCAAMLGVALLLLLPAIRSLGPEAALAVLVIVAGIVYAGATALFARRVVAPMWAGLRGAPSELAT